MARTVLRTQPITFIACITDETDAQGVKHKQHTWLRCLRDVNTSYNSCMFGTISHTHRFQLTISPKKLITSSNSCMFNAISKLCTVVLFQVEGFVEAHQHYKVLHVFTKIWPHVLVPINNYFCTICNCIEFLKTSQSQFPPQNRSNQGIAQNIVSPGGKFSPDFTVCGWWG